MGNKADENKTAENDEGQKMEPSETDADRTDPENGDEGSGLTDKHGQDAVAKGKYERDTKARDEKIAELQAKVGEAESRLAW